MIAANIPTDAKIEPTDQRISSLLASAISVLTPAMLAASSPLTLAVFAISSPLTLEISALVPAMPADSSLLKRSRSVRNSATSARVASCSACSA
jgi:hypothetical protein